MDRKVMCSCPCHMGHGVIHHKEVNGKTVKLKACYCKERDELRTYIEESLKEINGECSKFSTDDEYEELLNEYHRHIAELETELQAFSRESLMFIFYIAANSHKFPRMADALRKIYEK